MKPLSGTENRRLDAANPVQPLPRSPFTAEEAERIRQTSPGFQTKPWKPKPFSRRTTPTPP